MQNKTPEEQKSSVLKSLAIVGFIGLIIVVSWLGMQLVQVLPTAINSLASLADSVYNHTPVEVKTASNKSSVNVDEAYTISWDVPKPVGTFALSYACTPGLAVDIRIDGEIKALNCDTNYNLGSVSAADIVAKSERERFTDFIYTIDFIKTGNTTPAGSGTGRVSIVNPAIEESATETPDTPVTKPEVTLPTTPTTPEEPTIPPTPTKPVVTPKPVAPTYVQEYVYGIPTSNPSGFTDLGTRHLGTGMIIGGRFVLATTIDNDGQGAVQFEVKNIGTKTSAAWNYTVRLPNGEIYNAPMQTPLAPQERLTATIGFSIPNTTGVKSYTVAVSVSSDAKLANNSFSTNVPVGE